MGEMPLRHHAEQARNEAEPSSTGVHAPTGEGRTSDETTANGPAGPWPSVRHMV